MDPADGAELTDIGQEAVAVPQPLVTEYLMVSSPAITPVTVPPVTEALVLEALHTPPVTASVSVITAPAQTPDGPEIVPAAGETFIAMECIA
jgi:hypothetical protein